MKDPYVHLLESQSAMSMLMMQMAREMNQRSLQQQLPQQPQQQTNSSCRAAGGSDWRVSEGNEDG